LSEFSVLAVLGECVSRLERHDLHLQ
jgi:hypothetical protein